MIVAKFVQNFLFGVPISGEGGAHVPIFLWNSIGPPLPLALSQPLDHLGWVTPLSHCGALATSADPAAVYPLINALTLSNISSTVLVRANLPSSGSFSLRPGFFSYGFALDLLQLASLSDLHKCDDVLLLDKLLSLFPVEQALPLVQDMPEDSLESSSDMSFVLELSEFSCSDSSYTSFLKVIFALACWSCSDLLSMKNDIGWGASTFHRKSSSNKAAETCIHGRNDGTKITQIDIDYAVGGNFRILSAKEAWETIEDCAQCDKHRLDWNLRILSAKEAWETIEDCAQFPSFDKSKPQPKPLANFLTLDVSLGDERGPQPPIKPHSPDSFKMKVVEPLTIHTPPSPHVASFHPKDIYCYYRPCIDDPKKHYSFKLGLLELSGSLGVDLSKLGMINDDSELESKEVSVLGKELSLFDRPNED
ncbi:hypothetical protein Tco_0800177 [Tanacetum coccineum]|uniref:Uncharacterized protein n=1 Tax=Tanacetum coccineum TaxID=301880 RepID=A0ABQ4ZSD0_9ASTR